MKRNLTKWRNTKKIVASRDNGLCVLCGAVAVDVHHVIYRSHGGKDEPGNCVCLCRRCHENAHGLHKYVSANDIKNVLLKYLSEKNNTDKKDE